MKMAATKKTEKTNKQVLAEKLDLRAGELYKQKAELQAEIERLREIRLKEQPVKSFSLNDLLRDTVSSEEISNKIKKLRQVLDMPMTIDEEYKELCIKYFDAIVEEYSPKIEAAELKVKEAEEQVEKAKEKLEDARLELSNIDSQVCSDNMIAQVGSDTARYSNGLAGTAFMADNLRNGNF